MCLEWHDPRSRPMEKPGVCAWIGISAFSGQWKSRGHVPGSAWSSFQANGKAGGMCLEQHKCLFRPMKWKITCAWNSISTIPGTRCDCQRTFAGQIVVMQTRWQRFRQKILSGSRQEFQACRLPALCSISHPTLCGSRRVSTDAHRNTRTPQTPRRGPAPE